MMYPSSLHIPAIAGGIFGVFFGFLLGEFNVLLAIFVGIACFGLGVWGSIAWHSAFFKSIEEDRKKEDFEELV